MKVSKFVYANIFAKKVKFIFFGVTLCLFSCNSGLFAMSNKNIRETNMAALYRAIEEDNLKEVKDLVQKNKKIVNKAYANGNTPILMACILEKHAIVKFLLESKAITNIRDNRKRTLYDIACDNEDLKMVKILRDYNIEVDAKVVEVSQDNAQIEQQPKVIFEKEEEGIKFGANYGKKVGTGETVKNNKNIGEKRKRPEEIDKIDKNGMVENDGSGNEKKRQKIE